ncbi:DNA topoisomerase II [Mycena alexandri]|uniref:DNA topoisomerase 2 n=1 Tax=Mycena alexandri TaxID=1745969 RepID=A0AAD6T1L4_9AGAR|nr:DNA topoisomerase II [Mycena alexandri]
MLRAVLRCRIKFAASRRDIIGTWSILQQTPRLGIHGLNPTTTHTRHFKTMSSSEGENFDFDDGGSESEGYAPAKKTKKAAAAKPKAAPKAAKATPKSKATTAGKAKAAPKKKVLTAHNDADESGDDAGDASDADVAGPTTANDKPLPVGKNKTTSEKYTKLTQIEHILKRPDSYIGSVEMLTQTMWTHDKETNKMVHREVTFVPGFFKIVDEILVNAADHKINDPKMDQLKIEVDVEEGTISVYNNGHGIPIEIHSTENCYIPELIFGHLLAGSNFDDDEKKLTGGRNGYGAKLANIYSHEFTVETADKKTGQKYKQTWTNNMGTCGKAKITKNSKGEEWTKITFRPDLKRFGMDSIDEDTASLLRKRVYDMAGTVKDIKVFYNDKRITVKNFQQYIQMYISSADKAAEGGAAQPKPTLIYERIDNRWEVGFALSDGQFQHVAFANSISTTKGGTHVNLVADQISKNLLAAIGKKNKGAQVKAAQIRNHMWIFVNALIENPTFDSQTKDTLTLVASKFGTKPVLSDEFMKKVQKSPIIENILNWAQFKADQQIKKTDGTKRSRLTGMPKLADANNAGTKHAKDCTLILTEGDSAKSLAIAGLSVVGRDNFGVFPLRGKLLNVREARHDQIMKNEEIQAIKKIMGLQHAKDYTSTASLRYGRLMIMADQDHDGSHIKGLIINFLDHFYPSLLKLDDFLVEFVTPIVRVTHKTNKKQRKDFFTMPEYEQWLEDTPDAARWDAKYLQARRRQDERKEWLRQFKPGTFLDHRLEEISYSEFINKELILFSMADNIRSIPSVADGLKPGQRKVMWGCFKRNMKKELKVAQLIGYIGEHAAYHHGELSLAATNHQFGADPNGQFGTRDQGGKDHASARYINTLPTAIARAIYHPHDDPLLTQQRDDNQIVEPEWYMPVVPLVLINGAEGIGTGWSTNVPCFNPDEIVANLRRKMNDEEMVPMHPWWRGYNGVIKPTAKNKYDVFGVVKKIDATTVEITELPIHKSSFEAMIAGKDNEPGTIKEYREHHDNENVHFVISMDAKQLEKAEAKGLLEFFKLTSKITTSNMICFDFDGKIKKYGSPEEIIEDFYPVRLAYYQKRKDHLAAELQNAFEKLTNQARFKVDIIADLKKHKFRPFPKISKAKEAGEAEDALEDDADNAGTSNIERLLQTAAGKEQELFDLLKISPKEMWNTDLDHFLAEWEALKKSIELNKHLDSNGKKIKRKQTVLKTRKCLHHPPKKKRAPPSKATTKDEDDDDEMPPPPPKKRAPPKKPAKDESDSEVEVVKRAPPKKAKTLSIDSDDDDEPPKDKGKAKAAPKRKSLDTAVDSDEEPPKKKKSSPSQPAVTDFFGKAGPSGASSKPEQRKISKSMKPASPPKPKKAPPKKYEDSDDDMYDEVPVAPARTAPSRPARVAPKKYEDETKGEDSMFVDDDD